MSVNDDFLENNLLAKVIEGYTPRAPQIKMAKAVSETIRTHSVLVAEAGTGTGKTFAYLLPVLKSKKKAVISTGSKTLQDQLITKDLPIMVKALSFSGSIALLKGRSNYLCLERFTQNYHYAGDLDKAVKADLGLLRHWISQTEDGDINKCTTVVEESAVWPLVTSTNENCLGADCAEYNNCFVVKARRRAMNADIVVVNHHLFFADVVVKDTGFGELIPNADIFVFDEAHQLPEIASQYFGQQLSSRQLIDLSKQLIILYRTELKELKQLEKCADQLYKATHDLRLAIGVSHFRGNLRDIIKQKEFKRALHYLLDGIIFSLEVLEMCREKTASIENSFERLTHYQMQLNQLVQTDVTGFSYWYECSHYHFILGATPLTIDTRFKEIMSERKASWIFTSATLAINNDLSHFCHRLGLENETRLQLQSPFNYQTQSLLCVPRYLPITNDELTAKHFVDQLLPVIEANPGGCFFLCTSIKMMKTLTELFREVCSKNVLAQGESSKTKLLEQFVNDGNALLIATSSFWEGVDVRGNALSCVIIDKLPFTSPDDPLLKARIEDCYLQGKDPFLEVQIPDAVIALKQGVGRLIRDFQDRGTIIICDHRLVTREYGAIFLNSLPDLPRTRDLQKTIHFLTH